MDKDAGNTRTIRENVFALFGILMFFVYISIGCALLLIPAFLNDYPKGIKFGVGSLFIIYGVFRLFRVIRSFRN